MARGVFLGILIFWSALGARVLDAFDPNGNRASKVGSHCDFGAIIGETDVSFQPLPSVKPIPQNDRNPEPIELASSGIVLEPGQSVRELGDGNYLYLVARHPDGRERVVVQRRIPEEIIEALNRGESPPEKYLATHRAALRKLSEETGIPMEELRNAIFAAGQIVVRNGEIHRIDNKSGSFHGGPEHLDFAALVLRGYDAGPKEATRLVDMSEVDIDPVTNERITDHYQDARVAEITMNILRDPELREIRNKMLEIYPRLYTHFPNGNPEKLGNVDTIPLRAFIRANAEKIFPPGETKVQERIFHMGFTIQSWQADTIETAMHRWLEDHPREQALSDLRSDLALMQKAVELKREEAR